MGSMYVASDAAMMGRMLLFTYLGRQRVKKEDMMCVLDSACVMDLLQCCF